MPELDRVRPRIQARTPPDRAQIPCNPAPGHIAPIRRPHLRAHGKWNPNDCLNLSEIERHHRVVTRGEIGNERSEATRVRTIVESLRHGSLFSRLTGQTAELHHPSLCIK